MSEMLFLPKPPFTIVVFDLWDFESPGYDMAVCDTFEEAIALAREYNDEKIERNRGIDDWLIGGDVANVYGSNKILAFSGIEDSKKRYGFKGFNFIKKDEEGK